MNGMIGAQMPGGRECCYRSFNAFQSAAIRSSSISSARAEEIEQIASRVHSVKYDFALRIKFRTLVISEIGVLSDTGYVKCGDPRIALAKEIEDFSHGFAVKRFPRIFPGVWDFPLKRDIAGIDP